MRLDLFAILMILPWASTLAGSLAAVHLKINTSSKQGALLGFAAGVMIAASVWSLIIPAFDGAGHDLRGILVVTLGFVLGCAGMLALDKLIPHQHIDETPPEGRPSKLSRPMLLVLAVALHNIPEGLALGVVIAAAMGNTGMGWMPAIIFSLGLGLQNFPEGFAVVLPLYQSGMSKSRCTKLGLLASFAEPAAALLGLAFTSFLTTFGGIILPVLLSLAAGAMIFIVVEELIPESQVVGIGHSSTYGFLLGFWIMALMGVMGVG